MGEWEELGRRVVGLAERLVRQPSVVDTDGEAAAADLLATYVEENLGSLEHVSVKEVEVPKPTACSAVLAFALAPQPTARTLLLIGHIDTVGLEPYGSLKPAAFDSEALKSAFANHADPLVAAHASDPDWMFGRGWHDMKGGVAAITEVFIREARLRQLGANLVLLLTPDEESASRGLRTLIPELLKLRNEHGLEFAQVINADYTAPLFDGDDSRYLYSGVVGKLLLSLAVFGETTHVGETFDGVNPSALAGYLAHALEHNRKLLAGVGGEWLPPPTVLRAGDRRRRYDVMTLDYAELYINLFHLGGEPARLWNEILLEIRRLVRKYDSEMRRRYNRFVARSDLKPPRADTRPRVISYSQLLEMAVEHCDDLAREVEGFKARAKERFSDTRERGLFVIRRIHGLLPPQKPLIVASLLPPFYPARIAGKNASSTKLIKAFCGRHGLKHRWVYPYISDLSYFAFDAGSELEAWRRQSPLWFSENEVEQYRQASAPVCNLGPWGMGAHSAEERVYLPYLRDQLPRLITELLYQFAG